MKNTVAPVVIVSLALAAYAVPMPAAAQTPPSYARPSYASDEETVRGRIVSFNGQYDMQVRDDRGFIDRVRLRPGTVINPTGLTLTPGMSVTVMGYTRRDAFQANEIDTPYTATYPVPVPAYGYGYGYGPYYPYYYPYAGPQVIIAPGFGGGWHRGGGWYGGYGGRHR